MATSSTQEGGEEGTDTTFTEWIDVQKKTFTNWVNEKLKGTPYKVEVLENDLADGVTLIKLLETLANKEIHKKYNAKPRFSIQKSDNLEVAFEFMTKVESIKLENIGVNDITGHNLTLILALVWALILRYQMARRQPDTVKSRVEKEPKRDETADELLLGWIRIILPSNINNLTSAWNDGRNLSALVDYCEPGLIPNHASLDPKNRLENVRHAMTLAEQHLNIPQVMHPEDLAVDHPDKLSTMTYLSQFWWRSRRQHTSFQQAKSQVVEKLETKFESVNMELKIGKQKLVSLQEELSVKSQHIQELERRLDIVNEQLEREKQKQLLLQKEGDKHLSGKNQVIQELNRQLKSVQKELKMEKEKLLSLQEEWDKILSAKSQYIQQMERKLEFVNGELKVKQSLLSLQEERKEQLSARIEELERGMESLKNGFEAERLSKERELQKMTSKREKEVAELNKRLASTTQELETEKQKASQSPVQKEQSAAVSSQSPETLSLRHFSSVDPALRKNHKAYFRGFFLLRTPLLINGQPAQTGPNEKGWLTLRCPTTNVAVTFNDLYTEVSAAVEKYSGLHTSNYWCDDVPVFQLNVTNAGDLKKLLRSKSQLQNQLTTTLLKMFKKKTQVQLQSDIFLVLPSASDSDGQIVHVTLDNAVECMARWERSAVFTFQTIFQQWNEHSWRTEARLGPDNLGDLIDELDDVSVKWDFFGMKLEVPFCELEIIKHDCGRDARRCMRAMIRWWLDQNLEPKWSTIVQALAQIGKTSLAYDITLNHGLPTKWIADVSTASTAMEDHFMDHPSAVLRELMESVDELRRSIKSKGLEFVKQEEVLKEAEHEGDTIIQRVTNAKERMRSHHSRIEELMEEKIELENALILREAEIEILKESAKKERVRLIALREEEVSEYQKKLESVEVELEAERQKIPPLKEEIQQLLLELDKTSEENRHLRSVWEDTKSQLTVERERVEMKTKELTAAAVSHDEHMKEVKMQIASLKKSKKQKMKTIHSLQGTIKEKEFVIQILSQQIVATESKKKERISMELVDMKMTMIQLQCELDILRRAAKLSQEEARCYEEHATSLRRRPFKHALKWSDRKRSPKAMYRGAAVVHGTIVYVIGYNSCTIYSYQLDEDEWYEHSCPHVNPGLVIINDSLTAVGGKERGRSSNKLLNWNGTKWVETFPPMQTPRVDPAVVHFGDYVIVVGGDREGRGVELLHIPSLLWSTATSLPRPLLRITATLCHDKVIAMDNDGNVVMINIEALLSSIRLEESSTEHSQWMSLPKCPVYSGSTVTCLQGQTVAIDYNGIFQLQERKWVRIGDMSVPMCDCIVCVVCDQMVVVGGYTPGYLTPTGYLPSTDAVCVAVIV